MNNITKSTLPSIKFGRCEVAEDGWQEGKVSPWTARDGAFRHKLTFPVAGVYCQRIMMQVQTGTRESLRQVFGGPEIERKLAAPKSQGIRTIVKTRRLPL